MRTLFLCLLLLTSYQAALACDCLMSPVGQHIKATPYLLTGRVIEILDGNTQEGRDYRSFLRSMNNTQDTISRGHTARMIIQKSFKGEYTVGDTIEIQSTYSNCDILFDKGSRYVLFLHKRNNHLFPTHCSYSEKLNGSQPTIDLMKQIQQECRKKLRF